MSPDAVYAVVAWQCNSSSTYRGTIVLPVLIIFHTSAQTAVLTSTALNPLLELVLLLESTT
jgi:hypothetical protein